MYLFAQVPASADDVELVGLTTPAMRKKAAKLLKNGIKHASPKLEENKEEVVQIQLR